jgi:chromosome segregation ATPase
VEEVRASHRSLDAGFREASAAQARREAAWNELIESRLSALGEEFDKRLAAIRDRLEQCAGRETSLEASLAAALDKLAVPPAGPARDVESRFQDHAEAIQRLQDRVVRIERSNRELLVRMVQLRAEPAGMAAMAAGAQAG